eukprot:scaffold105_cov359-Prasinococcus_capsulatus_cf.AAC.2
MNWVTRSRSPDQHRGVAEFPSRKFSIESAPGSLAPLERTRGKAMAPRSPNASMLTSPPPTESRIILSLDPAFTQ